jgi:hypothetical protein
MAKKINWLKHHHGDDVTLTVSEEDQRLGVRGSKSKCAIVQTLLQSAANVTRAEVRDGNIAIWVTDADGTEWRGRLLPDNTTRAFAIKYDLGDAAAPPKITVRIDKWHEVVHYARAAKPPVPPAPENMVFPLEDNDSAIIEPEVIADTSVDENGADNGTATVETQTIVAAPKIRAKKSRWDVSHYLVPAKRQAA